MLAKTFARKGKTSLIFSYAFFTVKYTRRNINNNWK